jgi:hypothetical protein
MSFKVRMDKNYQRDIQTLRQHLEQSERKGQITIDFQPPSIHEMVELMMRCSDLYIIGFKGADAWYFLEGDQPRGVAGKSTGVSGNYNHLEIVNRAGLSDFKEVNELKNFEKGKMLNKKLVVLVAAAVSEAVRSAIVNTYMTGLVNQCLQSVPIEQLKQKYFLYWDDHCTSGNSDVLLKTSRTPP